MNHIDYFNMAAKIANFEDDRTFTLGAIGIRTDGVLVNARNGNSFSTKFPIFRRDVKSHAEGRILRKLDSGSIIYITRIKNDNSFGLSKPCSGCSCLIKAKKIEKVYYTIDDDTFGLWLPRQNKNYIYRF